MRIALPLAFASLSLTVVGCKKPVDETAPAAAAATAPTEAAATDAKAPGTTPATRDDVDHDGVVRRGDALPKADPMTVSAVMNDAATLNGKSVTVKGTVEQVCAKKGCWWMMAGEKPGEQIRITAKGYGFFVPRDAKGKAAVASGVLQSKQMSEEEARHMLEDAKEAGEPVDENAPLPTHELRLEAAALEMS